MARTSHKAYQTKLVVKINNTGNFQILSVPWHVSIYCMDPSETTYCCCPKKRLARAHEIVNPQHRPDTFATSSASLWGVDSFQHVARFVVRLKKVGVRNAPETTAKNRLLLWLTKSEMQQNPDWCSPRTILIGTHHASPMPSPNQQRP